MKLNNKFVLFHMKILYLIKLVIIAILDNNIQDPKPDRNPTTKGSVLN